MTGGETISIVHSKSITFPTVRSGLGDRVIAPKHDRYQQ